MGFWGCGDDSSSFWRTWPIWGKGALDGGTNYTTFVIDPSDNTNAVDDIGTFDVTAITDVCNGLELALNTSGSSQFGNIYAGDNMTLIGGDTNGKVSWATGYDATFKNHYWAVEALGSAYTYLMGVTLGDGTNDIQFDATGESLFFPPAADPANGTTKFHASGPTVTLNPTSGSTFVIPSIAWDSGNRGTFTVASGTAPSTLPTINNLSGVGTWSIGTDLGALAITIKDSAEIDLSTLTNLDLSGGSSVTSGSGTYEASISGATAAALQAQLDRLANTTVTRLHVVCTFNGDISLNFDNLTIDTLTYDNATATSTLTAVLQNGATVSTGTSTGDDSVSISNDVTFTVNIQDEAGSTLNGARATLLNRGLTTEIDEDASTTGGAYSYTYTYSSDTNADLQITLPGYVAIWDDTIVLGNADQTFTVKMVEVKGSQN